MPAITIVLSFAVLLVLRSLFGLDLFPSWVVYLAVRNDPETAILWSSFSGFLQDALFFPGFLNFLTYTILGGLSVYLKRFFAFEEDALSLTLVLILAPATVLITAAGMRLFEGVNHPSLFFSLVKVTALNGFLVFSLNYLVGRDNRS